MQKKDLISMLKKDVNKWNQWRQKHPDTIIDLSKAKLRNADLSNADLSQVDFEGADLSGSKFVGANLHRANLSSTNLCDADFTDMFATGAKFYRAKIGSTIFDEANLSGADFREVERQENDGQHGSSFDKAQLRNTNFNKAFLQNVGFRGADLSKASLRESHLVYADFEGANLTEANLTDADLRQADLIDASLIRANLCRANLSSANVQFADLSETNFDHADLSECYVYGASAWDLNLENAKQNNLVITKKEDPVITVDDLEVAQFIYLMINNQKIRNVIETVTSKTILILGRFTEERKKVLDALREELRHRNYLPIIFDFDKPASRDLTETVTLLARMARFIIADISDPKSIPQELTSIIPELPSAPVQTIILSSQMEYAMYEHWKRYPWVLKIHKYESLETLINELSEKVIEPSEKWIKEQKAKMDEK